MDAGDDVAHVLGVDDPELAAGGVGCHAFLVQLALVVGVEEEPTVVLAGAISARHEARFLAEPAGRHPEHSNGVVRVRRSEDLVQAARVDAARHRRGRVGRAAGDQGEAVDLDDGVHLVRAAERRREARGRRTAKDVARGSHGAVVAHRRELHRDGRQRPLVRDRIPDGPEVEPIVVETTLVHLALGSGPVDGRRRRLDVGGREHQRRRVEAADEHVDGDGPGRVGLVRDELVPGVRAVEDAASPRLEPAHPFRLHPWEDAETGGLVRVVGDDGASAEQVHGIERQGKVHYDGVARGDGKVVHHLGRLDPRHSRSQERRRRRRRRGGLAASGAGDDRVPHVRRHDGRMIYDQLVRDRVDARLRSRVSKMLGPGSRRDHREGART